jgi:phage-related baseplate assembly protein
MASDTVASVFAAVPDPQLFESDVSLIAQVMLVGFEAGYTAATGTPLTLGAADPRRYELLYQADLISQSYAAGNWVAKQNMLKYSVSANLDVLGSFWGDMGKRLAAAGAVCSITFSIDAPAGVNITVPAGTSVATTDPNNLLVFKTLADAVIIAESLFVITVAECTTLGIIANDLPLGSINVLQDWNQPYVVSASNSTVPSGGADAETDDRYRIRLYKLPKGLSTCGPKESYEFYALSANPSISRVAVQSNPGISGTVVLTPLMAGGGTPTDFELNQVLAACNGDNNRPLADRVIAASPSGHPYSVTVSANLPSSLSAQEGTILDNAFTVVNTFILNEKASLGGYIDPSSLTNSLSDLGFINVQVTAPVFEILADNEQPVLVDDPVFNYGGMI